MKKLLESQKELLRIKFVRANLAQQEITKTIDRIAEELGVPKQELKQWKISPNLEYIEKPEPVEEDKK